MRKTNNENESIMIVAQAFYGNRTATKIKKKNLDYFIQGILSPELIPLGEVDRTIVHIPGAEHLVLVYNKFQEEEALEDRDQLLKEKNYILKPVAVIPELGLTLYSRCIVCRMDEEGEFESLEYEDGHLFMHYLSM